MSCESDEQFLVEQLEGRDKGLMKLFVPKRKQRGVIEKFFDAEVVLTSQIANLDLCKLDGRGKKRLRKRTGGKPYVLAAGIARVRWKSVEHQDRCIENQTARNKNRDLGESRWSDTVELKDAILNGEKLPWPALVHPSLTGLKGLEIIDGARRFLAHLEAGQKEMLVVVVTVPSDKPKRLF